MAYKRKHDRHSPRSWISLYIRFGGWLALIFGAALVLLTLFSAGFDFAADQVDRAGKFARGAVVSKREETLSGGTTLHYVTFAYKTSAGGQQAEAWVSEAFYRGAEVDDEAMVRYPVDEPWRIEWDLSTYRHSATVLRRIGLVMGIIGLGALWVFGKRTNRAIIVRRDGEKRFAEVIGIDEMNVTVNGHPQGRLMWREQDGQMGESLMRSRLELSRLYQAGDKIAVFRLGDEAFWEGDVGPTMTEVAKG